MTLRGATVLVVDDEPALTMTFSVLLTSVGASVLTAENGAVAVDVVAANAIDVILTDKQMPIMDGIEMLRELRARDQTVPSVLFVSTISAAESAELPSLGVRATLHKPLHPRDLLKALEDVLAGIPPRPTA